jgi:hypothetical protein
MFPKMTKKTECEKVKCTKQCPWYWQMVGFWFYMVSEHVRIKIINCLTIVHFLDQSSKKEGGHLPQKGCRRRVVHVGDFCVIHKAMDSPP